MVRHHLLYSPVITKKVGDVDYLGPVTYPRWLDKMLRAMAKLIRIFSKKNMPQNTMPLQENIAPGS